MNKKGPRTDPYGTPQEDITLFTESIGYIYPFKML